MPTVKHEGNTTIMKPTQEEEQMMLRQSIQQFGASKENNIAYEARKNRAAIGLISFLSGKNYPISDYGDDDYYYEQTADLPIEQLTGSVENQGEDSKE